MKQLVESTMIMTTSRDTDEERIVPMKEYVSDSLNYSGERTFNYKLSEKSAKKKLTQSAKRVTLDIEENTTSSNLVFCLGSWYGIVLPSIKYWSEIKGTKTCSINDYKIRILGIKAGKDCSNRHVDTQIVFYADTDKITCHFYNTTQKILINGRGYRKLIDVFLKPFFEAKIDSSRDDIAEFNRNALEQLGEKVVKRSEVRYTCSMNLSCTECHFVAKNELTLGKHKKTMHPTSVGMLKSSTRNNSMSELLMIEDNTIDDLNDDTVDEATMIPDDMIGTEAAGIQFKCLEDNFTASSKDKMTSHVQKAHDDKDMSITVDFTCGSCGIAFVESDDYEVHIKSHEIPSSIINSPSETATDSEPIKVVENNRSNQRAPEIINIILLVKYVVQNLNPN